MILGDPRLRPWPRPLRERLTDVIARPKDVRCNVCGWAGPAFRGPLQRTSAMCPRCGASAGDRFLHRCWTERVPFSPGSRVLETRSRIGRTYRRNMAGMVDYVAPRAGERGTRVDLERITLPDGDVDVVLVTQSMERVVDIDQALGEIRRVLRPGGSALIAVPVTQPRTGPPPRPERARPGATARRCFGWDVTERLRDHGFETTILVTDDLIHRCRDAASGIAAAESGGADGVIAHAAPYVADMASIASPGQARRLAIGLGAGIVAWHARMPRATHA